MTIRKYLSLYSYLGTFCKGGHSNVSQERMLARRYITHKAQVPASTEVSPVAHCDSVDPYKLSKSDLSDLTDFIKRELLVAVRPELNDIANYYFDGQGKKWRPMVCTLMSRAVNQHVHKKNVLLDSQKSIACLAEMIHTASLVHDDVVDMSDARRGKPSANAMWGQKKAILAGDFILSRAAQALARIGSTEANVFLSQILVDLVQGEFMQLGSKEDHSERFSHYIDKTFKKTASLVAYSCKAVTLLAGADEGTTNAAYEYGKNIGIAFQLIDDMLDFVASQDELGKPAAADLKLGLATAPVLFAAEEFPELNAMIMRRFCESGDVKKAYDAVMESRGLERTKEVALAHSNAAIKCIEPWTDSLEKSALIKISDLVINRKK